MPLTPGAQIDELRRALGESERRRQAAEVKLADRERRLGSACQRIAAQDHRIGWRPKSRSCAAVSAPSNHSRQPQRRGGHESRANLCIQPPLPPELRLELNLRS